MRNSYASLELRTVQRNFPASLLTRPTETCLSLVGTDGHKLASMSESTMKIPTEFREATPDERIAFVQMLWDEIARDPHAVPITDAHKVILDERLQAYETRQDSGETWETARDRILADLRTR